MAFLAGSRVGLWRYKCDRLAQVGRSVEDVRDKRNI
jgi:hypothetical protein